MSALDELLKEVSTDDDEMDMAYRLISFREQAAAEHAALVARVAELESVLGIYANPDNWKSINGVMSLQTLSHPWGDAEAALRAGGENVSQAKPKILEQIKNALQALRSTQENWHEDCLFECNDILENVVKEMEQK